jgi:hypothetical protein
MFLLLFSAPLYLYLAKPEVSYTGWVRITGKSIEIYRTKRESNRNHDSKSQKDCVNVFDARGVINKDIEHKRVSIFGEYKNIAELNRITDGTHRLIYKIDDREFEVTCFSSKVILANKLVILR